MSKRMQILVGPKDYDLYQKIAKKQGISLGEWVRQVLLQAVSNFSQTPARKKLNNIRKVSQSSFPTGDIDQILSEIEKGYTNP